MKKYKFLSLVLSLIMVISCFSVLNISVFAEEVSDGFIYRVEAGQAVLCGLEGQVIGDVVVPAQLGGYDVATISGAFKNKSNIISVDLPDTVTVITKESFYNCSLQSIKLSSNLSRIADSAFSACENLKAIELPDSLTTLGPNAFSWCYSLSNVVLPKNLSFIDTEVFNGCSQLVNIDIPDSVNYIVKSAFGGTGYYNNESNWEDGVLYIGNHIIAAKKDSVFGRYVVKQGTKSISNHVFTKFVNLTEIVFPVELKKIGENAFFSCSNLKHIFYGGTVDQRRSIKIEKNNTQLTDENTIWHYGYDPDVVMYYPGDINGDNDVDNRDLVQLFKYLSDWDVEVQSTVLDVNGDKLLNNKDLVRLFQYLSGWSVKIYSDNTNFDYFNEDTGPVISF